MDGVRGGVVDELSEEVTAEELREFGEGDWPPVEADPAFVQRLRGRLWDLLQAKLNGSGRVRGRNRARGAPADPPPKPKHFR